MLDDRTQAGQAQPMLLTKSDSQKQIRLYQRLESVTDGEVEMKAMCLLQTGSTQAGLKAVWLLTFLSSYGGQRVRAVPLDTTATAPDFKYTPREWYALGEEHLLEPSIADDGSYSGLTGFSLNAEAESFSFVQRNITIDEKSGTLKLRLIDIPEYPVRVEITGSGIVNNVKTSFSFRVGCRDGYYHNNGMCVKCQVGTFNSLALVRDSPATYFNKCRPCEGRRTTVAEGSTSAEQCLCEKGYHIDETSPDRECLPCPAGGLLSGGLIF